MAWGSATGGSWASGGTVADGGIDPPAEHALAERWAVERARERGDAVGQLERVAVAFEARAWRNRHDPAGDDSADSAAFRRLQEQAAAERGQLGAYQEVYGRAPGSAA